METLIISGSRHITDEELVVRAVKEVIGDSNPTIYVGCAKGVDRIVRNNFNCRVFSADWKKYGKSAGPKRNKEMIDARVGVTTLLAIPIKSSKGTIHAIGYAMSLGDITVITKEYNEGAGG